MSSRIDKAEKRAKRGRRTAKKERNNRFSKGTARRLLGNMQTALREAEDLNMR